MTDESDLSRATFMKLNQKLEEDKYPYIGEHRLNVMKLIKRQIQRYETIRDNLYEDKLAGVISDGVISSSVRISCHITTPRR